jgi:LysM repeat protein
MKRRVIPSFIILILGLTAGCTYFTKKDEPPPLPPIEETKPPLKTKAEYFKSFPWSALAKPKKDGNDPDTSLYTFKEGDTLESVAEKEMGARGMAAQLAEFNDLTSPSSVTTGDKIVIPNPFIGVNSQIEVKAKKEKEFGPPQPFETELKKGDHYRMIFESNVDGYLYVFRESLKTGVTMLYPAKSKRGRRNKNEEPLMRDTGKVKAFEQVKIPIGDKGFTADSKNKGDRVMVFLSLRNILALEDLKDKKKISAEMVKDVMHDVNEADIVTDGTIRVMRVTEPSKILGFSLNIDW